MGWIENLINSLFNRAEMKSKIVKVTRNLDDEKRRQLIEMFVKAHFKDKDKQEIENLLRLLDNIPTNVLSGSNYDVPKKLYLLDDILNREKSKNECSASSPIGGR